MLSFLRPAAALTLLAATLALGADPAFSSEAAEDQTPIEFRNLVEAGVDPQGVAEGACKQRWRPGAPGVATRTARVGKFGPVEARLTATGGDWDIAVFDERGRAVASAAGPGATEYASGWADEAGELRVQVCRRPGGEGTARVVVDHGTLPQSLIDSVMEETIRIVDVHTPNPGDKTRLLALGLDDTHSASEGTTGIVVRGDADEKKLRDAGFTFTVLENDLVERSILDRVAERRYAAAAARSAFPSGRTVYRKLADYEEELKKLAQQNPGLVKLIEMPNKTGLGRTVLGIEITTNVNLNDGKPAFVNMGVHHAREWPAGEMPMEWAYELINGFKAGDRRATRIVTESRNIVVPIINPDGFNASREAGAMTGGDGGRDESVSDTALIVAGTFNGGEYRRKNCRLGTQNASNCATSPGVAENGTDPNRNYGGLWGGPGAGTEIYDATYRGPGPFSEPETRNVQWLLSRRQAMTMITNHTTAGLVLRAPGLLSLGDPVDEERGYKALGDAMALENGYFSQKSFELYDTTGTTEDWSYNATGGFGFTFEVFCGKPNYNTGNCDDPSFHPTFATMVKEWDGTSDQADHKNDPGRSSTAPFGMQPGYDGGGNREAYYIAAESTLNEQRHSVIEGDAPPGATLRLTKAFKTETYPQPRGEGEPPAPLTIDDKLDTTYDVPDSGKFRWHINPSTRPIVAKDRGRDTRGKPSDPIKFNRSSVSAPCTPFLIGTICNEDYEFDVPEGEGIDNGKVRIRIEWPTSASDYDLKIFRPGASGTSQDTLASSAQRATNSEEVTIHEPKGRYLVRVANVAGEEPWSGTITFESPDPFQKGKTETWTLSCELNGQVLQTTELLIERSEVKRPDLGVCDRRVRQLAPAPAAAPAPVPVAPSCGAGSGFRSVAVTPRGRGVRFAFARRLNAPVTISVFQQSRGGRITGEQLVARFTGRTKSFTWSGKANRKGRRVGDGYLFARYAIRTPNGTDVRRLTLRRSKGRFVKRPAFYRRATCDALPSFKIERPVFGGRTNRALNISFRLADPARTQVEVLQGDKLVRRFGPTNRRAGVTHRLRVDPKKLRRGEYRIRITVFAGPRPLVATLVARRL